MTKIEWTDAVWNPVTGCTPVSPGCANCYAASYALRLQGNPKTTDKYRNGFGVTMHPDELEKPLSWREPKKIFVCSMGDLFHEEVSTYFLWQIMEKVICQTPRHTYQILTKRPERMTDFAKKAFIPTWAWLGVTVCNQAEADEKIPVLLGIPHSLREETVRFISVEPMLESIDLTPYLPQLNWIIVGGETGRGARPMDADWARAIRDQCRLSETPFFFKQMAQRQPIPDDLNVREFPTKGGIR